MLTRVLLGAGVAALAIAAPAIAGPHGGGGGGGGHGNGNGGGGPPTQAQGPAAASGGGGGHGHGNGGGDGAPVFSGGGGGHGHGNGGGAASVFAGGGGGGHGHGYAAPQMRVERQQVRGFERQQARGFDRPQHARRAEHQQQAHNLEHQQVRSFERRQAESQPVIEKQRGRGFERRQAQASTQVPEAFQPRQERGKQFDRQALANVNTDYANAYYAARGRGLVNGCPPGLAAKNNGCLPPGQAAKLLGSSLATASAIAPLGALPQSLSYYYPDTSDYYYRYGDGYLYQVNRSDNLISSLLPLIGGGYMPGQYLPTAYMSSYVPQYYGLNSFYPDYGNLCNRYYGGVVYQTDCVTGLVQDVVPMYAGGYGVGQMLPSSYGYYNVPMQYRSMYYDTPNTGYYYAPGAIYQYDPRSSVITSVAALLSPGFTVGQQLPMGYDVYNVPYDYRATYYDTPDAWYRYNNGYIYQVDPVTQVVTAIVASLLT